jgi:hypothetical protein
MKIRAAVILFVSLLGAQGLSDYEILDVEINENIIVVGSKSGVNWKTHKDTSWRHIPCKPFGADVGATLDNIVLGGGNDYFGIRLEPEKKDESLFIFRDQQNEFPLKIKFENIKDGAQLYGFDGCYISSDEYPYHFAMGDSGIAHIKSFGTTGKQEIIGSNYCINSVIDYDGLTALTSKGKIMRKKENVWTQIDSVPLQKDELAIKLVKGYGDSTYFVLTTDTSSNDTEKLFRKSSKTNDLLLFYLGSISKAALTPDGFIYIINNDGALVVLDLDEKRAAANKRREIMLERIKESNIPLDYKLTDISIYDDVYSLAFATNKGVLYSKDEQHGIEWKEPFEYSSKEVIITGGLKQVYAEPGIINYLHNSCTFEYSLSQDDYVTIDIFNYNLDFVCRIVENAPRKKAVGSAHSTKRSVDKWDGTANNNGGRAVSPGVYYFKITTKNGQRAVGKVVVAK